MSNMIYVVSWLLAVFIHLNTLKRTALTNTKDAIIEEIYSLLEINKSDEEALVKETTFSHKFARIESKVKEFNGICKNNLIETDHDDFTELFTFDIEVGNQQILTTKCYDAVDYVDRVFHHHTQNRFSFFYMVRYELAGIISTLVSLYLIIRFVYWLHGGNI
ncbi:hypothetical protein AB6E05_12540 [Vibrio alginolyticus]|uniref:hypothetical protein n=1 Tax=Vibrio alginolyticus TaxID=663 RepID=UPI00215C2E29|nr:hypothetical protein [Vibrio alginolyticus]MCR9586352.1 hypothetical protein [Vibrio alginolyticus]MCR9899212.1 hypothetical protein [Vibrio alginolyticus]MCS0266265.1 hypothetical protein [Vibrio alginolyticus]MCS0270510.1 hypothetical protein [Vibrio alginolyticus]